jgi:hypothetical protein
MVSAGLIVLGLVVLVLIIGIALYILIRRNNSGTTGSTGSTGNVCSTCTTVKNGCSGSGTLKIGYTGANCSAECKQSSSSVSVSGCVAPLCGSQYCTPQSALYTNIKNDGTLYNFCNTGINTAFPSNTCNTPLTAQQLSALIIPRSSVLNAVLNPIFITTTKLSIYQTTQPTASGGIPQESIEINLTDPSVINNPYILYSGGGILSFQRISDILTLGDINNATWAYNTDNNRLVLFSNINQNYSTNSSILAQRTLFTYSGSNPPCGVIRYGSPSVTISNIYDPNSGLFTSTQNNNPILGTTVGKFGVVTDNNGNFLPTSTLDNFNYSGTPVCTTINKARWYGISAINVFLGK